MSDPASQPQVADQLKELTAATAAMKGHLEKLAAGSSDARQAAPAVRTGEDPLTSRGYSYTKLFQLLSKKIDPSQAKVEVELSNRLQKHLYETQGYVPAEANTIKAPFASEHLSGDDKLAAEVRERVKAGVQGWDPQEIVAVRKRMYGGVQKTLSWTDETALGALVAPPLFGELIEVLRNNEVFMQAGAQTVGLPPNGRVVYPRQTGASTAYFIGENMPATASEPATGDLILQAKKLASLIKVPNELFRFASVSVEMFLRQDMTKVMGLRMDKELLEGVGSSNAPKGLINYAGITKHTSLGSPADANSGYPLQPEDVVQMVAKVEEANAVFKAFVMRPLLWSRIVNARADAVTAGDGKGPFLFQILRSIGENFGLDRANVGSLYGYPVHKSTQLSNVRTRGTGTTNNTYVIGGDFNDYLVAVSPTIEFAMTQQGDTAFQNDQTWIRSILPFDGGPKHEASFVLCDNLLVS